MPNCRYTICSELVEIANSSEVCRTLLELLIAFGNFSYLLSCFINIIFNMSGKDTNAKVDQKKSALELLEEDDEFEVIKNYCRWKFYDIM